MTRPPSTAMHWPVTIAASSETRTPCPDDGRRGQRPLDGLLVDRRSNMPAADVRPRQRAGCPHQPRRDGLTVTPCGRTRWQEHAQADDRPPLSRRSAGSRERRCRRCSKPWRRRVPAPARPSREARPEGVGPMAHVEAHERSPRVDSNFLESGHRGKPPTLDTTTSAGRPTASSPAGRRRRRHPCRQVDLDQTPGDQCVRSPRAQLRLGAIEHHDIHAVDCQPYRHRGSIRRPRQ